MSEELILIENGTIVNEDAILKSDVLLQDIKIRSIGESLFQSLNADEQKNVVRIDATGCLVMPGGIDPHTHMYIIDFVIPIKSELPLDAYKKWKSWAEPKVCCDYGFSMAITSWNKEVEKQMKLLTTPEYGINSFKFFLAYKDTFMVDDYEFFQGLKHCAKIGALARVHAENGNVIAIKQQELLEAGIKGPEGHTQSRPEEVWLINHLLYV